MHRWLMLSIVFTAFPAHAWEGLNGPSGSQSDELSSYYEDSDGTVYLDADQDDTAPPPVAYTLPAAPQSAAQPPANGYSYGYGNANTGALAPLGNTN